MTPPTLARRLGVGDAVVVGLGAMLGAGVFAAFAPAAAAAGSGLLVGLLIAGIVAYCNATASAQLAAVYPQAGGTYVYGRRRLGEFWGYLAGWAFVTGKLASCAAMALTFGAYLLPDRPRVAAIAAVVAVTAINLGGVRKTALATRVIVAIVVAALAAVVVSGFAAGADAAAAPPLTGTTPSGVLQAAGILFFAFAGYARIATLGEEVKDPQTTIPRAIPLALGITVVLYALVALAALWAVGPEVLAGSAAPLVAVVDQGPWPGLAPAVRAGAAVASFGVLLSLTVGVSRTTLAMARNDELPGVLARISVRRQVPHRAEIAVAVIVIVIVAAADLRGAIGFSSFGVLTYYGIANASAWTQPDADRRWPQWLQVVGVAGCALLAFSLPLRAVAAGVAVLAAGAAVWAVRRWVSSL